MSATMLQAIQIVHLLQHICKMNYFAPSICPLRAIINMLCGSSRNLQILKLELMEILPQPLKLIKMF
jgi:hypothetical protein